MTRRIRPIASLLFWVAILASSPVQAQTAVGVWEQRDDPGGKINALVTIVEKDHVFSGFLSALYPEPGDDPAPRCVKCSGSQLNAPFLGLTFIEGMKRDGRSYHDGTILDPETGSVYSASMEVSEDGRELMVRGYLGLSIFGQTQTWSRSK